jgi:hypothetical protein
MFRTYAAWVRGATEADVPIIRSAMNSEKSAADWVRPRIAARIRASGEIGHWIGHWIRGVREATV